jgi:hypothetical protein
MDYMLELRLFMSTLSISGVLLTYCYRHPCKVKSLLMSDNQPVTKGFNIQVGTSETTRPLSSIINPGSQENPDPLNDKA